MNEQQIKVLKFTAKCEPYLKNTVKNRQIKNHTQKLVSVYLKKQKLKTLF